MSDLQIILIVIGALIICAVVLINWWQERRFHQQVESSFSSLQSDALLDDPKLDVDSAYSNFDDADVKDFSISKMSVSDPDFDDSNYAQGAVNTDYAVSKHSEEFEDRYAKAPQSYTSSSLEEESIDDVYLELQNTKIKHQNESRFEESNSVGNHHLETGLNIEPNMNLGLKGKPAQHDDIKAIFNEAFSQTKNPVPTNYQNEEVEQAPLKAHEEMAQYGDVKAEEPIESLPAMLHSQMDLTALLYLAAITPLSALKSVLANLLEGYDKPVFVHVLDENNTWHEINEANANLQITRIACSLQLADRGGPVSRQILNRFQLAVETIGLDMNAHVEWQNPGDAYTAATALDSFCLEVDKTMGFHLVHGENGPFTGTKLRGLAESQGLTLDTDGTFKFYDDIASKKPSFVMLNRDAYPFSPEMLRSSVVKGVTFQLDIPHVKQCAEAFSHMVQIARQMEIGLNATLVDDNNRPLGDIQIEKIRQQLKVLHATMLVRGIIPGSDSAHRLFS